MNLRKITLASAALLAMVSFKTSAQDYPVLDPSNIDHSVRPGDNFFKYANGNWLKNNPIPATETRWGSFNELQENNYKALHQLLDDAAKNRTAPKGSRDQKVGDFYRSGMDSVAIEKAGITPLNGVFSRIDNIKNINELIAEIGKEHTEGIGTLYGFGVSPDDKNVSREIVQFGQAGIGLPDRDYYFNTDARTTKIRDAYKEYIPQMFMLMGEPEAEAKKDGKDVYDFEVKLATASMTRVERRDPYKTYNKYSLQNVNEVTPGLDWKKVFASLEIKNEDTMLIGMPVFFKAVAVELTATPMNTWKKYLKFHLVNGMAPFLSSKFDQARFDFYSTKMRGQKEQKPRWKRVLSVVDGSVGELLGQMYVEKYFTPEAKKRMQELVNNLQETYADRIKNLEWMSDETKKIALVKLGTFVKKIGYTDKWKDYSKLTIGNVYVTNIMASAKFEYDYDMSKLGHPVDRTVWGMTPPTVNAYYNPGFNEIVFPAGILQFPFFNFKADDAVNYGGIGAVIGHEMTHGFDDEGRLYDASGNLTNWWTPADSAKFEERAGVVVKQFNNSVVLDTVHVNGKLTEGENLADLGGLSIAYQAFKKTKEGHSDEKIDGFTPDQRFFLSWAQVWRANTRDQEMASRIMTDPHSPSELRCNVPISNMEAWYKAFNIQPTDKMYRPADERAKVW
ncbi:MAG: M13 family metallopeptidase [Flavipsychrobacter sp.]|nr:M13 family metallopeptidase [Flavipsychrobacter sp.]